MARYMARSALILSGQDKLIWFDMHISAIARLSIFDLAASAFFAIRRRKRHSFFLRTSYSLSTSIYFEAAF